MRVACGASVAVAGLLMTGTGIEQATLGAVVGAPPDHAATMHLDCGTVSPTWWLDAFAAAVARGEIPDPRLQARPRPAPPAAQPIGPPPCLTPEHIFPFEDTGSILLTNFSDVQLFALLLDAVNTLLVAEGDNYDFVGFWLNFEPHHTIGAAFYAGIQNDVSGIGLDLFDAHDQAGLIGERLQGIVMMWNVTSPFWQPGDGPDADFTRLALGQEFEHRFAMFLPPLLDGRVLQGDDANCGRGAHWNWQVDGQGSGMEISEWVGSQPAIIEGSFVTFNTDIGGVFSYTDLYLMGYVSPEEMDAGNSELRFMEQSNCSAPYFGPISDFSSTDIVASAGVRAPSSAHSQKDFRTAWIMLHLPGAPPTDAHLSKAVGIMEQHMIDWRFGTLERGTMDNSLFADCNCNGVPDAADIGGGGSDDDNNDGIPDECEPLAVVSSDPPDGAIDARQPSEPDGSNQTGWSEVVLTFNADTSGVTAADFTITLDPPGTPPVLGMVIPDGNSVVLRFGDPVPDSIPPGHWTIITHAASGTSVRLGYLPSDVNNDGISNANDVLALIDEFGDILDPGEPAYHFDVDRSGLFAASDILRVIDLLNGAAAYDVWNGATLPE